MDRCPMCSSPAFVLFTSVECTKPGCTHYAPPRAETETFAIAAERSTEPGCGRRPAGAATFDAWARKYRHA